MARLFENHETLSLREAAEVLDANPNTLKLKFRELVAQGLIELRGKGRGSYYVPKMEES